VGHFYIPHFDQISVKISVLGSYTLIIAPMGSNLAWRRGLCRPCGAKNLKISLWVTSCYWLTNVAWMYAVIFEFGYPGSVR